MTIAWALGGASKGVVLILAVIFMAGCASPSTRMKDVEIGMSKADAINIMGEPDSIAASPAAEHLVYRHKEWGEWYQRTYYVTLVDGKVYAFGQQPLSDAQINQNQAAAAYMLGTMSAQRPTPVRCTTNQIGSTAFTNCN